MAASNIRFGPGVTREVGMDLADIGARRVMVLTDRVVARLPPVEAVLESLEAAGIEATLYDRVRVEPTDESFADAIAFARSLGCDAFVAVGGGSAIDTAKAVNLYSTYPPEDFLDYVNPPIGRRTPGSRPLKPLMAMPTTAGTGSETTGVAIFDLTRMHAKTGIASRRLKPTLGLSRSGEHADAAAGGRGRERPRRSEPRDRVLHGDSVYRAAASGTAVAASRLSGIESDQRRLGAAGATHRRSLPGARRGGSVR